MFRIAITRNVEAAHRSDQLGSERAGRDVVHGHSYVCRLWLEAASTDKRGVIVDLDDAEAAFAETCAPLDHALLNDVPGLPAPTMEEMARWLYERAATVLPHVAAVEIERPTLGFRAEYRPS